MHKDRNRQWKECHQSKKIARKGRKRPKTGKKQRGVQPKKIGKPTEIQPKKTRPPGKLPKKPTRKPTKKHP